jgi:hypothetical protein
MWLLHLSDEQRSRPPAKARPFGFDSGILPSALRDDALPPDFMLRGLRMRYVHPTRSAPRLRANASETRLMGNVEIGSTC